MLEDVMIEKMVPGGQALAVLADGRKAFIWNALPGEKVAVRLTKGKRSHAEGLAEEIITPSAERVAARDEAYLSTSPWQIMNFDCENQFKKELLAEALSQEKVEWSQSVEMLHDDREWHYRNKMEYSFWADDDGLHIALFNRGSHGKRIITGSSIARPEIDEVAARIIAVLNKHAIRGSQLKTMIIRCNQAGQVVCALMTKDENFPKIEDFQNIGAGVVVCYSNPKSPASVMTHELYGHGSVELTDSIAGQEITYNVFSFFQVNLPVFVQALSRIDAFMKSENKKIDLYSGVGTIGIAVHASVLVEVDAGNCVFARRNADGLPIEVVESSSEGAVESITSDSAIIVDPPRAGLHDNVTKRILDVRPPSIAYLSCNPSTLARDLARLQGSYEIQTIEGYNFFPKTPHIEALAILRLKK